MSHESDDDMEYDPSDVEFTEWLASKIFNYKTMDHYTMKALWIYWARGDDEVEITDEESSDSEDEDEVAKIFRIKTNVFDFETPLCRAFKKFNYLLQINLDLLTEDIEGFKTYEDYKDDWIYEWNKDVPWVHEKPWTDNRAWKEPALVKHYCEPFNYKNGCSEWPTRSWRNDGYCNGGNLPGAYIVGNTLRYQDFEWYEALKDGKLKEEALKNKAIMEGIIKDEDNESSNEESIQIESHKSSIEHPIVNEFIIINIPEEDVEPEPNLPLQEIIILDPDDQPTWENAKIVAPTPNSAIVRPNVDDNFVINSTHLKMILENKFVGIQRADPHDHIREFLVICNMFRYGETQSEAVKLLIFPFSLCDEAKTWFNELNEESKILWEQMRRAFINRFFPPLLFNRLLLEIRNFSQNICESLTESWLRLKNMLRKCHGHGLTKGVIIQIFYHSLDKSTQAILDKTAGGIFLYKSQNQAFQFLDDKVLFNHDWPIKSKNGNHQKSVAFADGSNINNDKFRLMEKLASLTIKMDSQIISLNEELQDMREKYNELRNGNASKNHLNDDMPTCERHEANYIQSEELNNDVRKDLADFKRCVRSMRTVHDKLYDRDDGKTTGVLPKKKSKTVNQEPQTKTDLEKSITKFLDGQRITNMFFKNNVNDMILKMKQNEKNFQTIFKNMERIIDE
ncbi:reverse transcriptase domain-containing protein [Tanacetum coccineum]